MVVLWIQMSYFLPLIRRRMVHGKHIINVWKKWNQIVLQDPQHQQEFNAGKKLLEGRVEVEFMTLMTWVPTFNMVSHPSLVNLPYYPVQRMNMHVTTKDFWKR
ncbi:hypothetical protein DEO72_LG10g4168 [Vigna unguiculata]|uniref:Uncharacterized protein n=1 Tax=Vigna unguiculata TaxID=3917 RepID=A0A4D6NM16_VIGUN|nr:hypothetical protein DEO72_LG10g4168 [Vigna unguiculata]